MLLTVEDIVREINLLPRGRAYHYVFGRTPTTILIDEVVLPQGPIYIKRYRANQGGTPEGAMRVPISTQMISRIANAYTENGMLNFDRMLGGSYNTRSALEALLAHTPQFYTCYPGRLDSYSGRVVKGHKHLMWCPNEPHTPGVIIEKEPHTIISELATNYVLYDDALALPQNVERANMPEEIQRQHARIQLALIWIGRNLGYRSWIAQNDRGIEYAGQRFGEMEGVIQNLRSEPLLTSMGNAPSLGLLIDCIWFGNHVYMPAVMEIEHTTGITPGLTRMQNFKNAIPSTITRYVVVAPDEDRHNVVTAINRQQYRDLNAYYFSYSGVEELLSLTQRRHVHGITPTFIETYLEDVLER